MIDQKEPPTLWEQIQGMLEAIGVGLTGGALWVVIVLLVFWLMVIFGKRGQ